MNILEAIRSGKRFRRPNWNWRFIDKNQTHILYETGNMEYSTSVPLELQDILAEDWEIEEEKKELSWDEITTVLAVGLARHNWEGDSAKLFEYIKKKLGFKE